MIWTVEFVEYDDQGRIAKIRFEDHEEIIYPRIKNGENVTILKGDRLSFDPVLKWYYKEN